MTDYNDTTRALAQITDQGLFENLATDVLRRAEPNLYTYLGQPGVNADGKTKKSPVDSVAYIPGANPPHVVKAHHTTCMDKKLKYKWLFDPNEKQSQKNSMTIGDVIKTIQIVKDHRKRNPKLRVTLALTTNREPTIELREEVALLENAHKIAIDIWSRSRLASYLDNECEGQWLRERYLGIKAQRLSIDLLRLLSQESVNIYAMKLDEEKNFISRDFDQKLSEIYPNPVTIVIGESGYGKTVACFKKLKSHIEAGGCGLLLNHETLAAHQTFDQAIDAELRRLHPSLEKNSGINARKLCSDGLPLLIVVEDINNSNQSGYLLERLMGWNNLRNEGYPNWRLLCPVWSQILPSISLTIQKRVNQCSMWIKSFNSQEARAAIEHRMILEGKQLSPIEADNIAEALGYDPLLIGLYDFASKSDPSMVIESFIENNLCKLSILPPYYTTIDYRMALQFLGKKMLENKKINPTWQQIEHWIKGESGYINMLRQLLRDGTIIRFSRSHDQNIEFRHDRIGNWILSQTIIDLIKNNQINDLIISDPFFSDIIGEALINSDIHVEVIEQIQRSNPLALFYALRSANEPKKPILNAVDAWLTSSEPLASGNSPLLYEALHIVADIESKNALELIKKFPESYQFITPALGVSFKNGNLMAGIQICLNARPSTRYPWRDDQIIHAKMQFGSKLSNALSQFLKNSNLSSNERIGALYLAGYLAEASLLEAITQCWETDLERINHLFSYFWAVTLCTSTNDIPKILITIFENLEILSNEKSDDTVYSKIDEFITDVRLAFQSQKKLSQSVILHFIKQVEKPSLYWLIIYILGSIDHPDAVEFIAREAGSSQKAGKGIFPFVISADQWENCVTLSVPSKHRLRTLWENESNDEFLRRQAFRLWEMAFDPDDLKNLRTITNCHPIEKDILSVRIKRGDITAIPALFDNLKDSSQWHLLYLCRHIPLKELTIVLEDALCQRRKAINSGLYSTRYFTDDITSELLMRLDPIVSEKIHTTHWDHLCSSPKFMVTALYSATVNLSEMVEISLKKFDNLNDIFKNISSNFGIKKSDHPGVSRLGQLEVLIPYFNHIEPSDIYTFWELCNQNQWFDFRKKHLDARMIKDGIFPCYLTEEKIFSDWNKMIERKKGIPLQLSFWIEKFLDQGETTDKLFNLFAKWFKMHRSIPAVVLFANAVIHIGKRAYLSMLSAEGVEASGMAEEIIAQARFIVSRRSID